MLIDDATAADDFDAADDVDAAADADDVDAAADVDIDAAAAAAAAPGAAAAGGEKVTVFVIIESDEASVDRSASIVIDYQSVEGIEWMEVLSLSLSLDTKYEIEVWILIPT